MQEEDTPAIQQLWGGAVEVQLPSRFVDISPFRDVPDHQEIFADANTDQSFIFELLSYDESVSNENITRFHWEELARLNDSLSLSEIHHEEVLNAESIPCISSKPQASGVYAAVLAGNQKVSKHRDVDRNDVNMYVVVIRLPSVTTDIMITFNDPVAIHSHSSSSSATPQGLDVQRSVGILKEMVLKTFNIKDWSLFG
eukprot:gb/GECH01002166.1/.p1 GENE.gb/GECH01002166.1/~~gb/GECH01002166.1/.p1  ORF type:complete len:198 (+),score=50.10 gb/GECH01002166.1/:1-594(+)